MPSPRFSICARSSIIDHQFGSWGVRPWFIAGTKGQVFIAKAWETHPFVATYFVPRCPFVGPLFGMFHSERGWNFCDLPDYGDGELSDKAFAEAYNDRTMDEIVSEPFEVEFAGADGEAGNGLGTCGSPASSGESEVPDGD